MLAKLITHGRSRVEAIRRLQCALSDYRIAGVAVNSAFLHAVLGLETFGKGEHLTSLLGETWPEGWQAIELGSADLANALLAWHLQRESTGARNAWSALGAWRLGEALGFEGSAYYWLRDQQGELAQFRLSGRSGHYAVTLDGETLLNVHKASYANGVLSYHSDGHRRQMQARVSNQFVSLQQGAATHSVEVLLAEDALLGEGEERATLGNQVLAPTPGLVAEVLVSPGDQVHAGQPLVVLEAMKLFQELVAPGDGVISQVHCQAGDSVNSSDLLVSLASEDEQEQTAVNE
jgi:acetyl/propionyl-CoA carboxylase alpha subunit